MNRIWEKIKQHQGETFHTVRGLEFSYRIEGEKVIHRHAIFRKRLSKRGL